MDKVNLTRKKWHVFIVLFSVLWIACFILSGIFFTRYTSCFKEKSMFSNNYGLKANRKKVLDKISKQIEIQNNKISNTIKIAEEQNINTENFINEINSFHNKEDDKIQFSVFETSEIPQHDSKKTWVGEKFKKQKSKNNQTKIDENLTKAFTLHVNNDNINFKTKDKQRHIHKKRISHKVTHKKQFSPKLPLNKKIKMQKEFNQINNQINKIQFVENFDESFDNIQLFGEKNMDLRPAQLKKKIESISKLNDDQINNLVDEYDQTYEYMKNEFMELEKRMVFLDQNIEQLRYENSFGWDDLINLVQRNYRNNENTKNLSFGSLNLSLESLNEDTLNFMDKNLSVDEIKNNYDNKNKIYKNNITKLYEKNKELNINLIKCKEKSNNMDIELKKLKENIEELNKDDENLFINLLSKQTQLKKDVFVLMEQIKQIKKEVLESNEESSEKAEEDVFYFDDELSEYVFETAEE
ncbi:hypothetical protein EHP00_1384 [Ecytonucleospora hepatopenaei]|uniref:Uncharacterized protein n=1 Tax=Ecytonucleospora hepatopenaei TaxID=646526 RepID=A0A1W0E8Y0_9MICR|nr:hypothetical protein EHP00_1384 [Ecytonucleospora hepatopenaei]